MTDDRGTIVFADDPFKGDDASRPWLIIGTDETPFHGEQYIALTLSTKTWYDERVPIDDDDLVTAVCRRTVRFSRGRSHQSKRLGSIANSACSTRRSSTKSPNDSDRISVSSDLTVAPVE